MLTAKSLDDLQNLPISVAGQSQILGAVASVARGAGRVEPPGPSTIDLHTHTTASDGELTVEESLCRHFVRGQILINDHNIIDSLAEARRLVHDRDLELDVFLGIEVICTRERRAFEFQAIAPTLSGRPVRVAYASGRFVK